MAVDRADGATQFERISRLRGRAFEVLSLAASMVGILMLAVLLVYVTVDAFNLQNASAGWLLSYYVTLVLPFLAFSLYSARDRALLGRTALVLGVGMVASAAVFTGIDRFVRSVPRLSWPLFYLFVVVVPTTAYVGFVGSRRPVGLVGLGVTGRLVGGAGMGAALFALFGIFQANTWLWAYTLGVFPAVCVYVYSHRVLESPMPFSAGVVALAGAVVSLRRGNPTALGLLALSVAPAGAFFLRYGGRTRSRRDRLLGLVALVVAVGGFLASTTLGLALTTVFPVRPITFWIYTWTLVVPLSAVVAVLVAGRSTRAQGVVGGGLVFLLAAGVSQLAAFVGVTPSTALLYLLATSVPVVTYGQRTVEEGEGVPGLALPAVLVGGSLAGAAVVRVMEFGAPNPWLDPSFLSGIANPVPTATGFFPPIVGSVLVISMVAVFSFVLGVGTAVFLEEYTPDSGPIAVVTRVVQVNIANLAAVPSVVYGLLGLGVFVNLVGFGLGTAITAAVTLSLLILPITVISAQEAIRSVPDSLRNASYAMGATRWQTTRKVVLPEAFSGILTGTILALGRAIGETAPLIMIGAPSVVFSAPDGVSDKVAAMPMQIFVWSSSAKTEFQYGVLAAGVVTLLAVLLALNGTAIILRNRSERE